MKSKFRSLLPLLIATFLVSCGGGGGGGGSGSNLPTAPELTAITITPATSTIAAGTTQAFVATGSYSDGTTKNISDLATWSSASTAVATISSTGLATAVTSGTSMISAALGSTTNGAVLTVSGASLQSITILPANPRVAVGGNKQLAAHAAYSDGTTQDVSASVAWSSLSTVTTSINGHGTVSGIAAGSSTISASLSGVTGATTLMVNALPTLDLFAGNMDGKGNLDGTGAAARFNFAYGIVKDAAGNLFVTDTESHTVRKITPAGVVSTFAGSPGLPGSTDGTGSAARFKSPYGITIDAAGNLYVADGGNHTVRKITPAGAVTTLAGKAGMRGVVDATGTAAQFNYPHGITIDSAGNLYVTESHSIRKVTPVGVVTTFAGGGGIAGSADGTGTAARFSFPTGITADPAGNLYVSDSSNFTVRKITPAGVVTTLAGTPGSPAGCNNGPGAGFNSLDGIAVDSAGNIYVVDTYGQAVRMINSAGVVNTFAGRDCGLWGSIDGTGTTARFLNPSGITIDTAGDMYITDTLNYTIRKITPAAVVTTIAGSPALTGRADGMGATARFSVPYSVAADAGGNLYVADAGNNAIRKVSPVGEVVTLAGGTGLGSADGLGTAAQFSSPYGVAADSVGNIYVADSGNHTIRKISPTGNVTTLAGSVGVSGNSDGTGSAARFYFPYGVAVDGAGNIYVADTYNHAVRKVTPAGAVTTLAGSCDPSLIGNLDGTGTSARFYYPRGITTDASGNVYVGDYWNNTVRKVTAAGMVTTLAGSWVAGNADGTGAAAQFYHPHGVAADSAGNLYVADSDNHTVRKISATGVVSTVLGSPALMGFADGLVTPGLLATPMGVAVHGKSLFILNANGIAVTSPLP